MFFLSILYMYSTLMQWWRLGALKNKLRGTLNAQNALLVCKDTVIHDPKRPRCFESLLFKNGDRIACTIVPKRKVNLSHWATFPNDADGFPIRFERYAHTNEPPCLYVLVHALLDRYHRHRGAVLRLETFGDLVAWRTVDNFEAILKTDVHKLTTFVNCFAENDNVDINHELHLLKIETVDVEGHAVKMKPTKKFTLDMQNKYSHSPVHWRKFSSDVRDLYAKSRQETNPKITIQSGSVKSDEGGKKTKEAKKEDRNTLDVSARRHKSKDKHKEKKELNHKEAKVRHKEEVKENGIKKEDVPKVIVVTPSQEKTEESKSHDKTKKEAKAKTVFEDKTEEKPDRNKRATSEDKTKERRSRKKLKEAFQSESLSKKVDEPGPSNESQPEAEAETEMNGHAVIKPPNILVYADSPIAKQNVKDVLQDMLNKEKYTLYDLPTNPSSQGWNSSTVLVVVCGTVPANLVNNLLQYLVTGGQLLCLCSDLLYSVLHTFTTAEVREHELVRFSYDQWKQVKMMHHIFCYQASPAKKQFSKDSDHSNPGSGNGSSPIAPRTPTSVEIQHNGKDYLIQVQVLGAEETWQTPSLLKATVKGTKGRAIFSQVHLEINPNQYEEDENKFAALKESDQARLEIFKDILTKHLDIDCGSYTALPYTPAYFLGRHDLKLNMLSQCPGIENNLLTTEKLTVHFCGKDVAPDNPTSKNLPVLVHSCPQNFSTVNYFESLNTETIGRLVIYSDVMTSSQDLLEKPLAHGLAIIPRQQTHGVGRSNNTWISPIGSAMFSLQLHMSLDSPLGKSLPLVQHMVMVAVVEAIKSFNGCEYLNVGIKWPNDLYASGNIKIGGLVVKSILQGKSAVVNVGVGVNLNNSNPTTCLNDLIRLENMNFNSNIPYISYERYFATVFNHVEKIFNIVQGGDMDYFYDLYYQCWLHKDAKVTIQTSEGERKKVNIKGIDEYGFLSVETDDGVVSSVQPDGNTFDMMKGLIAPKIF